jgi:hypothetical protein
MHVETREYDEISATVKLYIQGMCEADETKTRAAFHPKASIIGHYQGAMEWDSVDAFVKVVAEAVSEPDTKPYWRINSMTITGDTAVVQVEDIWLGQHFDDTLGLVNDDGRWRIVSKIFFVRAS